MLHCRLHFVYETKCIQTNSSNRKHQQNVQCIIIYLGCRKNINSNAISNEALLLLLLLTMIKLNVISFRIFRCTHSTLKLVHTQLWPVIIPPGLHSPKKKKNLCRKGGILHNYTNLDVFPFLHALHLILFEVLHFIVFYTNFDFSCKKSNNQLQPQQQRHQPNTI